MTRSARRDHHDDATSMTRRNAALVDDKMPEDINAFRGELLRRMNDILREWRSCDQPICRRARKCVAKNLACSAKPSTMTPAQASRAQFLMKRALEKRLAECRDEGDEERGETRLPAGKGRKNVRTRAVSPRAKRPAKIVNDRAGGAGSKPAVDQRQQKRGIRANDKIVVDQVVCHGNSSGAGDHRPRTHITPESP